MLQHIKQQCQQTFLKGKKTDFILKTFMLIFPHFLKVYYTYLTHLEMVEVLKQCVVQNFAFGGATLAPEKSNLYNKTDIS